MELSNGNAMSATTVANPRPGNKSSAPVISQIGSGKMRYKLLTAASKSVAAMAVSARFAGGISRPDAANPRVVGRPRVKPVTIHKKRGAVLHHF